LGGAVSVSSKNLMAQYSDDEPELRVAFSYYASA